MPIRRQTKRYAADYLRPAGPGGPAVAVQVSSKTPGAQIVDEGGDSLAETAALSGDEAVQIAVPVKRGSLLGRHVGPPGERSPRSCRERWVSCSG